MIEGATGKSGFPPLPVARQRSLIAGNIMP
jgi:hypothetical protein